MHGVGLGNIFQGGKIELRKTGFGASKPPPPKKEEPAVPGPAALKPTPHSQPPPPEKKAAVPPAAKKKAKKPADTRPLVKVIFDYEKQNEDELELKVGQFVRVTKKEDEGRPEGGRGVFGMLVRSLALRLRRMVGGRPGRCCGLVPRQLCGARNVSLSSLVVIAVTAWVLLRNQPYLL